MDDVLTELAKLNPCPDSELVDALHSERSVQLLRSILRSESPVDAVAAAPRRSSRRLVRRSVGIAAAALLLIALIAALLSGGASRQPPRLQLVSFTRQGPNIVARITDPTAPSEQLTSVFRAHGLAITVTTLPVSPSLVGSIVYSDVPSVHELHHGSCVQGGGGSCWIGMVIPATFRGHGDVAVGRRARPGEDYDSSADVFGPGEALHCAGVLGRPVARALQVLEARQLTARWQLHVNGDDAANAGEPPRGFVVGGTALSARGVLLIVDPHLPSTADFTRHANAVNTGCER